VKKHYGFLILSLALLAAVAAAATGALSNVTHGVYRLVGLVGQVVGLVQSNYVEPVDVDTLATGALTGLVEAADPGGMWVPRARARAYERLMHRELPPFGVVLAKRSSYPFVLEVLAGSPAAAAKIQAGDLIERVGDQPVRARPLWMAELPLGDAESTGRTIALDVISRDLSGKRNVTLEPGALTAAAPRVELKDGTPIVNIPVVDERFAASLAKTLAPYAGADAVVVDLTATALGTPAGAAQAAAVLAGGAVALTRADRAGKRGEVTASAPARTWKLFVCIDLTTARAGELLAAALKQRGATLLGRESFGDTGERAGARDDGGELWLARSWFLGPDGSPLLGDGLKPDEVVRGRPGGEPIVERALELARGHVTAKAA
jgi:carboxyl-terminal processing protease